MVRLTGTAIYSVTSTTGHQGRDNIGLHLTYAKGPLTAVFSAQRVRTCGGCAVKPVQYLYPLGAAYDARFMKVYRRRANDQQ